MISENDLEYLATCSREENRVLSVDANVPDSTVRVSDMAKELLTLRREKQLLIENSERIDKELVNCLTNATIDRDSARDVLRISSKLMKQVKGNQIDFDSYDKNDLDSVYKAE